MNQKGFTLVELLATMAVLAVLMLLAIPNVIGVVQNNKNKTYIEDAKKLVTLAEYKISSNPDVKPESERSVCFYMEYLDLSKELDEPPNGGEYDRTISYVLVNNNSGTLKYSVQLLEKKNGTFLGIGQIESSQLFEDDATSKIKSQNQKSCSCNSGNCHYIDRNNHPQKSAPTPDSGAYSGIY